MTTKQCRLCGKEYIITDFIRKPDNSDGRMTVCRYCYSTIRSKRKRNDEITPDNGRVKQPYYELAGAILEKAVSHLKRYRKMDLDYVSSVRWKQSRRTNLFFDAMQVCRELGYDCPRDEILNFWKSEWCIELMDAIGVDTDLVKKELSV